MTERFSGDVRVWLACDATHRLWLTDGNVEAIGEFSSNANQIVTRPLTGSLAGSIALREAADYVELGCLPAPFFDVPARQLTRHLWNAIWHILLAERRRPEEGDRLASLALAGACQLLTPRRPYYARYVIVVATYTENAVIAWRVAQAQNFLSATDVQARIDHCCHWLTRTGFPELHALAQRWRLEEAAAGHALQEAASSSVIRSPVRL